MVDITPKRNDTHKVYKVDNYIITMALNHDASLLAVAFGRKIALLSNWFSGKLTLLGTTTEVTNFTSLDSMDDAQISYLSTKGLMPKSPLGLPQNIYFLDEYNLIVFFLHRVMYVVCYGPGIC